MLVAFYAAAVVMIVSCALLCVALWNALAWPRVGDGRGAASSPPSTPRSVSILIPARDEEANIAACLDAALAQGPCVREVLVYDDHSKDQTAQLVSEYARRDSRVRLVATRRLPAGWCGKTFACAQLAREARGAWLLFLDADARLDAGAAALIVREAEARSVSLLSCWPRLEMRGFWEGALMPLLNFVVFTLYPAPLALRRRGEASLGLAHGSCVLARRDDYELMAGTRPCAANSSRTCGWRKSGAHEGGRVCVSTAGESSACECTARWRKSGAASRKISSPPSTARGSSGRSSHCTSSSSCCPSAFCRSCCWRTAAPRGPSPSPPRASSPRASCWRSGSGTRGGRRCCTL